MTDVLARLIRDLSRLHGSAAVGALDEETAKKLLFSEFGTVTSPPRPTLSVTTDRARASIDRAIARRVGEVMDGRSSATGEQVLRPIAGAFAEQVREQVDGNTTPPLAPSTLASRARRGRGDRTLVDSGDMMRGIAFEVSADAERYDDGEQ